MNAKRTFVPKFIHLNWPKFIHLNWEYLKTRKSILFGGMLLRVPNGILFGHKKQNLKIKSIDKVRQKWGG